MGYLVQDCLTICQTLANPRRYTKSKYALLQLVDLADAGSTGFFTLNVKSERGGIIQKNGPLFLILYSNDPPSVFSTTPGEHTLKVQVHHSTMA